MRINLKKGLGYTLIELVIVILITVILMAAVYTIWPGARINLDAQASLLANDIRYAQNLAMARGARYRFVKASSNSYQITDNAGAVVTLPFGGNVIVFDTGISFGTITNLPNNLIVFDSKGVPYIDTAGTTLNAVATINLVTIDRTKTISISPETGRVIIG